MSRRVIDCRSHPDESGCSLTFVGEEQELLHALEDHSVRVHRLSRGPELSALLCSLLMDERAYLELEGVPLEAPTA